MLISILATLLFGCIYFYLKLPAVNLHAVEFYTFIFLLCAVYCAVSLLMTGFRAGSLRDYVMHDTRRGARCISAARGRRERGGECVLPGKGLCRSFETGTGRFWG